MKRHYFDHDYDARNDQKILQLRFRFGAEGYGLYWMILESMAQDTNGYINRGAIGGLSISYGVAIEGLLAIFDYCVELGLFFVCEHGNYYSKRMLKHKQQMREFTKNGTKGAEIRWKNRGAIAGAITGANTGGNAKESKGKESKVKERDIYTPPVLKKITDVVTMMNDICGTSFRDTSLNTRKHIHARITEGYHKEDFEKVIRYKFDEWNDDSKMSQYLRPDTLFGAKFESYLVAAKKEDEDGFR